MSLNLVEWLMDNDSKKLPRSKVSEARERRLEAMHLQALEGNPLDAEDIAMFEMFERERWTHERCRAYILAKAQGLPLPE
jgi:hypothetical protein